MGTDSNSGGCTYIFDIKKWKQTHDERCHLYPDQDAEILTERNGSLVWECPHQPEDGKDRCVFHPPPDDDSVSDDAAAEFRALVNSEQSTTGKKNDAPLQFIGAQFENLNLGCDTLDGDTPIDLRHSQAKRLNWDLNTVTPRIDARGISIANQTNIDDATFEGGVAFRNATFGGKTNFKGAIFKTKANFEDATFKAEAEFNNTTFRVEATFWSATFEANAGFGRATFDRRAAFAGATFEERADFNGVTLKSKAIFRDAMFGGWAAFLDATFEARAEINGATFRAKTSFPRTTFEGESDFEGATFDREAVFVDATFRRLAKFTDATFDGEVDFDSAIFEGKTDFEGATFEEIAEFTDATFHGQKTTFQEATFADDISFKLNLSNKMFPSYIFLQATDFSHATIHGTLDLRIINKDENIIGDDLATFGGEVDFTDATIRNAELDGIAFENRYASDEDSSKVTFANADLTNASIRNADFTDVNASDANFTNTTCRGVNFTDANLEGAIFSRANLSEADFENAHLYGTLFGDARISNRTMFIDSGSWWTWLPGVTWRMQTILDDPRTAPQSEVAYNSDDEISPRSRAASIYAQLELLARENARSQLASTCFRWRKDMERDRYMSSVHTGTDYQPARGNLARLTNLFSRYGDSPWRVIGWSGATILAATVLLQVATKGIRTCTTCESTTELPKLLYFSVVTFTTLGGGDFQPAGTWAQWIAGVESLVGALLIALLVAVLGRRATR